MNELRILFTGVGRRIELLQSFRNAAFKLDINLKIFGADVAGTAPALAYCDYTKIVCGMKEDHYIEELAEICRKDKIDLLIPTIDTDLLVLSKNKFAFGTTTVLISDPEMITICRDKNKTADFFVSCGCHSPKTVDNWLSYSDSFPCFIKPKDGSSSINAFRVDSIGDLEMYAKQIGDYIVQPFIEGTEYTVDVFCDFEGNPIYITPRIRLQVRAGEVIKTQISMDGKIIEECKRIIKRFKPVGPLTIQLIRQNITGKDYFIEINPRYGGGAPLSMKAGARSAEAILNLLLHQNVDSSFVISDGTIYSRFDQTVCIRNGEVPMPIKGVIFDLENMLCNVEHMDMIRYITNLSNCNIKSGIVVNGSKQDWMGVIVAHDLEHLVDDIIFTDELGGEQFRLPCDIVFRIFQRRWRFLFEEISYIGTEKNDSIQVTKQLGMQWVCMENLFDYD